MTKLFILYLFSLIHAGSKTVCPPRSTFFKTYSAELDDLSPSQIISGDPLDETTLNGEVFKCKWNGQKAVVTYIRPSNVNEWSYIDREIRALVRLSGVQGVEVMHGCAEGENSVMVFLDPLYKNLSDANFHFRSKSDRTRIRLYRKIAEAFVQIHAASIVHNDFDYESIYSVDEYISNIKISGFAYSCITQSWCTGEFSYFNSPEKIMAMALKRHYYSKTIDVWAFLLTIAFLEGNADLSKMKKSMSMDCFQVVMTQGCYETLIANISVMMEKSPPGLSNFVLDNLIYNENHIPRMKELHKELFEVEAELVRKIREQDIENAQFKKDFMKEAVKKPEDKPSDVTNIAGGLLGVLGKLIGCNGERDDDDD